MLFSTSESNRIEPGMDLQGYAGLAEDEGSSFQDHSRAAGRGCSSVGRAVALQAIGQEFDSPQLHQPLTQGGPWIGS